MDRTDFWRHTVDIIRKKGRAALMYVLQSEGSSPGRQGFKMLVAPDGELYGTIGGGIMEHKLVELCKDKLKDRFDPFLKHQIHQNNIPKNKSGMICSGEQYVAFYYLDENDLVWLDQLIASEKGVLELRYQAIEFKPSVEQNEKFILTDLSENNWSIKEDINWFPELLIVGGGHVSLALSKIASNLDFKIRTFDDREGLNTVEKNAFSEHTYVDSYENIDNYISSGEHKYVVLMSFGYQTDKIVLRKLIDKEFKYLGMMGSKEKVKQLFKELKEEGVSQDQINKVHSPIGVQIASKTVEEIAISILAEIIQVKNQPPI